MTILEFGRYQLNEMRGQLLLDGKEVSLQPKTLQLLFLLVQNSHRTVTKDEIIGKIWEGRVVEENNLAQRIFHLRRTLDQCEETKQAIVTVSGVGYRFNVPVTIREMQVIEPGRQPNFEAGAGAEGGLKSGDASKPPAARGGTRWSRTPRFLANRLTGRVPALILLVLVAGLIYAGWRWRATVNKDRFSNGGVVSTLVTLPGSKRFPAFSPDGKFITFTASGETSENYDIYVKMVNQADPIRITNNAAYDQQSIWSPDGLHLAFLRAPAIAEERFHLIIIPAFGGVEREVGRVWGGLAWSPDGQWLAVSDKEKKEEATGIWLLSVDGSMRRNLSKPALKSNVYDTYPAFSRSGEELLFVRWTSDAAGELFVANIADGRLRQLTFDQQNIQSPQWSPDGKEILFVSSRSGYRRLWRVPASGGAPSLVENFPADIDQIAVSPTTGAIAFSQNLFERAIDVYTPGDKVTNGLDPCKINSSRPEDAPRISPDGQSIVFESQRTGWNEIWTARTDCTRQTQVTNFGEHIGGSPAWSADGKRIIFSRFIKGQSEIASINADGTDYRQLTFDRTTNVVASSSRDGQWIYFNSDRTGPYQVYRMPAAGGPVTQVTTGGGFNAIESYDSKFLIYNRNEVLWRKDLVTGEESKIPELAEINVGRYWDLTPEAIYYVPQKQKTPAPTYRYDLRTKAITLVDDQRRQSLQLLPGLAVSALEDRIAISYLIIANGVIMQMEGWK